MFTLLSMTNYECIVLDKANQRYLLGWRGIIETIIFNMVIGSVSLTLFFFMMLNTFCFY